MLRFRSSSIRDTLVLDSGRVLVLLSSSAAMKIVSMDPATGQTAELWSVQTGPFVGWREERGGVLVWSYEQPSTRVWWLSGTASEIHWSAPNSKTFGSCVIGDTAYSSPACLDKLKQIYPVPSAWQSPKRPLGIAGGFIGNDLGGYLLEDFSFSYFEEKTAFYLRQETQASRETLLAWNASRAAWTTVAENVFGTPKIGPMGRVVVYLRKVPDGFAAYLYDAAREKTVELGTVVDRNHPMIEIHHSNGEEIVAIAHNGAETPALWIKYNTASGRLLPAPKAILESQTNDVLFGDEAGNWIVGSAAGIERWNADGSRVRLWPPLS
jgi:hypothetical protein